MPDSAGAGLTIVHRWAIALATITGFGGALLGFGSLLVGADWWVASMGVVTIVVAVATVASFLSTRGWIPIVGAATAGAAVLVLVFAGEDSIAGVIPTPGTLRRFSDLVQEGVDTIVTSALPAPASTGVTFVVAVGVGFLALGAIVAGTILTRPVLIGIALLVLLAVPSVISRSLESPVAFVVAAASWLVMQRIGRPAAHRAATITVGAAAVAMALVIPVAIPPMDPAGGIDRVRGLATGVNPIVTLGNDLRRPEPITALSYETTAVTGLYLKLTTLDRFSGRSWLPAQIRVAPENTVDELGRVPGLSDSFSAATVTTSVAVANVLGSWLPAPYPARRVEGLVGRWFWEPRALAIRTTNSSIRGQKYVVESLAVRPTADQLRAATPPTVGERRYLEVPEGVPPLVAELARSVAAAAPTAYDKAIALQAYFLSGEFEYSTEAPVAGDYDGSGAEVVAEFLRVKSGYCVHFASAMAIMARTLGIPSRVAVGFQPGTPVQDEVTRTTRFVVSSSDLHAWPELYFGGVGWVRFEPTPGRGQDPNYDVALIDDPATPNVDESLAAAPLSSAPVDGGPLEPEAPVDAQAAAGDLADSWVAAILSSAIPTLVLLFLLPGTLRALRRRSRLRAAAAGSAIAGWTEILATAADLGIVTRTADSPRVTASRLDAGESLGRVVWAVEREVFGRQPGAVDIDDVRAVLRSLMVRASLPTRILALALPASLDPRMRARGKLRVTTVASVTADVRPPVRF